jgi:hypothetical protein
MMMLSAMAKKTSIKKALKWIFSGFSIFFIGMLVFIVVYDALTGASSETTAEYCAKYGFLASPGCW